MKFRRGNSNLTILICCYNAGESLKKCLISLIGQSISSSFYKVLFVNDASTDNSFEIAKAYSKKIGNFTFLNNKKNKGLVECCNEAIKKIETPYFIRLDADDWLSCDAVEKILKNRGSLKEKDFIVFKRWDVCNKEIKKAKVCHDIYTWIAAGTAFNTEAVRAVGGYSNEYWEEYDLYLKLLEAGNMFKLSPYSIYYYRRGRGSLTADYKKKKKGFESLLKKWKPEVLNKYGNSEKIVEYYNIMNKRIIDAKSNCDCRNR